MEKSIMNSSRKYVTAIIALLLTLTFTLTGCGVEELLQDLSTDYIQVSVKHELQSESYRNEQLYTYQINAVITNNYIVDLSDASITLDIPADVEIVKGKSEFSEKISCGEENVYYYTWLVAIKPTEEDRNVEYSVSVASKLVTAITAYESIFVQGKNENDNRLDFSVDTWSFKNYVVKPIPITQDDYDALLLDLSNTDRETIKDRIKAGANGQCYGMAITTILAKSDRLDLNRLQSKASNLHSVSKNEASQSIIAYYYLTQFLNPAKDKITQYVTMGEEQKLNELIELSSEVETGGTPVLLCFYLEGGGGHAVVAFGCEECEETYDGKTYKNRILIYDNNSPDDFVYLYFNDSDDWVFLYKDDKDELHKKYNASSLGFITATMEDIDISNLEQNRASVYSYITSRNNANIEVSSNGTTWKINGTNTNGAENVVAYYDIDAVDNSNLNIAIRKDANEDSYTVKSQDGKKDLDVSINYDNFYISAKAEGDDQINLSPTGSVEIKGETSDFNLSITANEGYAPTDWSTISIDAKNATNPKLEITDIGYILSGEDLEKVNVYAENATTANELTLSTEETKVLLTQEGENLCVKADEDDDGEFETVLVTGTSTPPDDPTGGGSGFSLGSIFDFGSGFKFDSGSVGPWVIVVIAGVLLLAVAVTVIVIALNSKKKKHYDEIDIPVVNQTDDSGSESNVDFEIERVVEEPTEGISVLTGVMAGMHFVIADGQTVTVGKDAQLAHVVFDNTYRMVSRVHCTISYSAKFNKYFVIDCSTNGTYFENGQRLAPNTRTPVDKGTILKLADDCKIKLI